MFFNPAIYLLDGLTRLWRRSLFAYRFLKLTRVISAMAKSLDAMALAASDTEQSVGGLVSALGLTVDDQVPTTNSGRR